MDVDFTTKQELCIYRRNVREKNERVFKMRYR